MYTALVLAGTHSFTFLHGAVAKKGKGKGVCFSPVGAADLQELTLSQSHPLGEEAVLFPVATHTVPIFVPPGTHYFWVEKGGDYHT